MGKYILIIVAFVLAMPVYSSVSSADGPHITVSLLSQHKTISIGNTQWIGILLSPDPEWHTYWKNPGDSGEAPTIKFKSNSDIQFGDIQWPLPEQIPVAHLVNYGYSGDILLMVPITLLGADTNMVDIIADISWLVCKEDCIPGWATLSIQLPIDSKVIESSHAELFNKTRERLPQENILSGTFEINSTHLAVEVETPYPSKWQLMPIRSDITQHNLPQQWLQ